MHLLVLAATGPEMTAIKSQIKSLNIPGLDVHFFTTGIGNYETIFSLTKYLESKPENIPDFLLNLGVCGYKEHSASFIQVARIISPHTSKEIIVPIPLIVGPLTTIMSSETIITDQEDLLGEYCDMESLGIELVCQKYQIPRIFIKVPVDRVGEETKHFDYKKALTMLEQNIPYREVLEHIMKYTISQTR